MNKFVSSGQDGALIIKAQLNSWQFFWGFTQRPWRKQAVMLMFRTIHFFPIKYTFCTKKDYYLEIPDTFFTWILNVHIDIASRLTIGWLWWLLYLWIIAHCRRLTVITSSHDLVTQDQRSSALNTPRLYVPIGFLYLESSKQTNN